jgi:acetolactate synthase-1/2/3 large subunit
VFVKMRGAQVAVRALEDEGVRFAFGIPGTHNIELYDALESSKKIEPVLVTDEQSASFMADGVSRASATLGVLAVVPGAGISHALSGIAEAYMDNVPLLVLAAGIRTDTGKAYQVHAIDQLAVLRPVVKEALAIERAEDIYAAVRRAARLARGGSPGPVVVEIPVNLLLHSFGVKLQDDGSGEEAPRSSAGDLDRAAQLLDHAENPALYLGNGARGAARLLVELAEKISAPAVTTIQGKGVFPENHPLWLWNNFGPSAPGFVNSVMQRCDCLLAVGCRFSEVATASYGLKPPANLIHVDIDAEVLGKNYPAKLSVQSDAQAFVEGLLSRVEARQRQDGLHEEILAGHRKVWEDWQKDVGGERVTPAIFFRTLQKQASKNAVYVTDSGNGTFLSMEHLRLNRPGCFIGPVDFSCMGYSVPAAIGAKLVDPDRDVVALTGDGALLMTGLELLTASSYQVAPLVCVLRDGELGQIVQLQRTSMNRETCSILPPFEVADLARATHCRFLKVDTDGELDRVLAGAFEATRKGEPVLVEVNIDYSRKTYFTKGIMTTNFWRLPWSERLRMAGRAVRRRLGG